MRDLLPRLLDWWRADERAAWPEFGSFAERVLGTGPAQSDGGPAASGVCLATVVAAPEGGAPVGGAPVGRSVVVPGVEPADAAEPDGTIHG